MLAGWRFELVVGRKRWLSAVGTVAGGVPNIHWSLRMLNAPRLLGAVLSISIVFGASQSAQAQWRGHYVHKVGVFGREVERYHWGGGITPNGAVVLGQLINVGGAVASDFLGSGGGNGSRTPQAAHPDAASIRDPAAAFQGCACRHRECACRRRGAARSTPTPCPTSPVPPRYSMCFSPSR